MKEKVIYRKVINQCRECPNCILMPDFSPDWFNDTEEKAICSINDKVIECALWPRDRVDIPKWCPLKYQ